LKENKNRKRVGQRKKERDRKQTEAKRWKSCQTGFFRSKQKIRHRPRILAVQFSFWANQFSCASSNYKIDFLFTILEAICSFRR